MERINGYGAYQQQYYNNTVNNSARKKTEKTENTKNDNNVKLSENAKQLLKELQKKYKNADFFVASYETEEEAAEYLAKGSKEYSVLIDPEQLEKMASDEKVKEKYMGILDKSMTDLSDMKEQLEKEGKDDEVVSLGVSVDKNGNVSYFAELEKMSEKQKERIEKTKADKKEKAAEQKKADEKEKAEKTQKTRVEAGSIEELLEKIRNVDWDGVKPTDVKTSGSRFDCTI